MRRSKTLAALISLALISPVFGAGRWYIGSPDGGCNQLLPNADTANVAWVAASAGNLYDELDQDPNTDTCYYTNSSIAKTTYIYCPEDTACNVEFDLADTSLESGAEIEFVYVEVDCAVIVGGGGMTPPKIDVSLEVGGTEYAAATNIACSSSAVYTTMAQKFWEVSPDTGVAWTAAELDAASLHIDQTLTANTGASRIGNVNVFVGWPNVSLENELPENSYSLSGGN